MMTCPNCLNHMSVGTKCRICEHKDRDPDCKCDYCETKRKTEEQKDKDKQK